MPAVFGALTVERDDVDFSGDFAPLPIFSGQRMVQHDLGALRIASCERDEEAPRIALCRRTGATLLLKGFLDSTRLSPVVGPGITGDLTACELLSKVLFEGRESVIGLPGIYLVILWEPALGRLSLMADELGLYPVYTWSKGKTFLFGTQTWLFSRARGFRRDVDPQAVVELLRVEHLLGNRSMVAGVSLMPPGALLEVKTGGTPTTRIVRDVFRDRDPEPESLEAAAHRLGLAYDEVFSKLPTSGKIVIPLSGGKDSRTVASEILLARPDAADRITTFSLGSADQWDARCASKLAATLGVPWRLVPLDPTLHDRWLERYALLMDGTSNVFATWWAKIMEEVDDPNATIASGYLGDALSGAHFDFFHPNGSNPAAPMDYDPGVEFWLTVLGRRCFTREALARTLKPEIAAAYLDAPAETLRQTHFELGGLPRHTRMIRSDFIHRQRRFIASQVHLYRQRHSMIVPFIHPSVVRAFLSMNEAQSRGQRAYSLALGRRNPRAARVMESRFLGPVHGSFSDRARCKAEVAFDAAWKRIRSRLGRSGWPEQDFFMSFAHEYRENIVSGLEPLDRFFDLDKLRVEIAGDPPTSNRIRILHTIRTWLRRGDSPHASSANHEERRAA